MTEELGKINIVIRTTNKKMKIYKNTNKKSLFFYMEQCDENRKSIDFLKAAVL